MRRQSGRGGFAGRAHQVLDDSRHRACHIGMQSIASRSPQCFRPLLNYEFGHRSPPCRRSPPVSDDLPTSRSISCRSNPAWHHLSGLLAGSAGSGSFEQLAPGCCHVMPAWRKWPSRFSDARIAK